MVYASSIPQGARKMAMMTQGAKGAAPVWYSQVKNLITEIYTGVFLARATYMPRTTSAPTTAKATESCHYTALLTSGGIATTPTLGPETTNAKLCEICTPVVNNEDSCTTLSNYIVQTGAVTVQAGSSPVHVGTLTGTQLYTSVSSALETLCPPATQTTSMTVCATDTVTIKDIPFVNAGFLSVGGELLISVESSQYNLTSLRNAKIKNAALTAKNAATGSNCYNQEYGVEQLRKRDDFHPQTEHTTWCNTVGFAGVDYYNPYWRAQSSPGSYDWIDTRWSFSSGSEGDFTCELLQDLVEAFAIVQPEFAVGDIELERRSFFV